MRNGLLCSYDMTTSNIEHLKAMARMVTDVLAVQPPKHEVSKHLPDASFFVNPFVKPINPVVQGSMALLLLGVDYKAGGFDNPADIDISVSNLPAADVIMRELQQKLEKETALFRIEILSKKHSGPSVVNEYLIVDVTKKNPDLLIQLVDVQDFGFINTKSIKKIEIPVTPPEEALRGLIYAIKMRGARPKDTYAYTTMIKLYHKELAADPLFSKDPKLKKYLRTFSKVEDKKILKHKTDSTPDEDSENRKYARK